MSWKSRATDVAIIFAVAGSFVGWLLGSASHHPQASGVGFVKGLVGGGLAGFLIVLLGHWYKNLFRSKMIGGAVICSFVGLMIGAVWGLWNENEEAWRLSRLSNVSETTVFWRLVLQDGIWGGCWGALVGFLVGGMDRIIINLRHGASSNMQSNNPSQSPSPETNANQK